MTIKGEKGEAKGGDLSRANNNGRGKSKQETPDSERAEKADESIGRPKEWGEGRYSNAENGGHSGGGVTQERDAPHEVVSTPVTQRDYEKLP
jgi:hypothetical protein